MKCPKCYYEWDERIEKPKSCPRCKTRLDYEKKDLYNSNKRRTRQARQNSKNKQEIQIKHDRCVNHQIQ